MSYDRLVLKHLPTCSDYQQTVSAFNMSKKNYAVCDGDKCHICDEEIVEEGLRCSDCDGLSHLSCTGLPTYALVHFALTRAVYVCATCVVKKENKQLSYEEACKKIERLKNSETEAKEAPVSPGRDRDPDQDDSGTDRGQGLQPSVGDADAGVGSKLQKLSPRKDGIVSHICKHYLQKKCKHGRKGENCKFDHPKLCIKYLKFGRKARSGCQKGSNCEYHHPRLCWEYSRTGWCSRVECRFYHSKGDASATGISGGVTGLSKGTSIDQKKPDPVHASGPSRTSQGARRWGNRSLADAAAAPGTESGSAAAGKVGEADFLLLLSQLQAQFHQMQSVMQTLLTRDAETARVRPSGTAWPREQVFSLPTYKD